MTERWSVQGFLRTWVSTEAKEKRQVITIKKIISSIVFLALLIWVIVYVKNHLHEFGDIRHLSWPYVVALLGVTVVYYLMQGLILKVVVQPFGVRLRFHEWFGTLMVTLLGNYVVPFGGFGFRAAYLKKVHSLDYTHFLSTLAATYAAEFLVFTGGGLVALIYLYPHSGVFDIRMAVMLSGVFLVCLSVMCFSPRLPRIENRLWMQLHAVLESWYSIRRNHDLIRRLMGITLIEFVLYAGVFYVSYRALGLQITMLATFLPACLSDYAFIIRITPASLGFYEGAVVFSSKLLGMTIGQGLLVAGIIRIIGMFWIFSLGPIFSYLLASQSKKE